MTGVIEIAQYFYEVIATSLENAYQYFVSVEETSENSPDCAVFSHLASS